MFKEIEKRYARGYIGTKEGILQWERDTEWLMDRVEFLEKELKRQSEHFDVPYDVVEGEKHLLESENKRYKQAINNIKIWVEKWSYTDHEKCQDVISLEDLNELIGEFEPLEEDAAIIDCLRRLIQFKANDLLMDLESKHASETTKNHITELIIGITRYLHDIRYCSKVECPCSPETKIKYHYEPIKDYLQKTKTALHPVPWWTIEEILINE